MPGAERFSLPWKRYFQNQRFDSGEISRYRSSASARRTRFVSAGHFAFLHFEPVDMGEQASIQGGTVLRSLEMHPQLCRMPMDESGHHKTKKP